MKKRDTAAGARKALEEIREALPTFSADEREHYERVVIPIYEGIALATETDRKET